MGNGDIDMPGKGCQSERKEADPDLKDSDADFEDLEQEGGGGNALGDGLERLWTGFGGILSRHSRLVKAITLLLAVVVYNCYFIAAIWWGVSNKGQLDYCDDVGFLIIITVFIYIFLAYFLVVKRFLGGALQRAILDPAILMKDKILSHRHSSLVLSIGVVAAIAIFIFVDTASEPERLVSAFGLLVILPLGFVFSRHPGRVVWRHVVWGVTLQFLFGLLILRWPVGKAAFGCLGKKVSIFLDYTDVGSSFVFGYLVDQKPIRSWAVNGTALEVAEQFNGLFNFFISMLFYLGSMQWLVVKLGWLLQVTMGTTAAESMNASANIFLGQSEAPLMIRPYLKDMTKSEIHAVMTGGFATIAGSVLAAYISFGVSASHLLSASVMSAPAALAFSKLFYPETKKSRTKAENLPTQKSEDANILDAASNGASQAVFLVGNIAGSLIAFLAFVAFLNGVLSWCGGLVGAPYLTFEWVLGWVFYPLAFVMGVPCGKISNTDQLAACASVGVGEDECDEGCLVAVLVGLKTIVNEFAAYDRLRTYQAALSPRAVAITTFALCGFSNPASVGVQIAALSFMAPTRRAAISEVALRAFISGSAACFLTACIAGALIPGSHISTSAL